MARLEVCATIYPAGRNWLLVGVGDADGKPVLLKPENLHIILWASEAFTAPSGATSVSVAELDFVSYGDVPPQFYSVRIADLPNEDPELPGTPVTDYVPLAYSVVVTTEAGDQGMAIATLPT